MLRLALLFVCPTSPTFSNLLSARILDPSWVKKLVLNTLLKGDRRKDFRACKRQNVPQKCQSQDCYTCTPAMTDQVSQAKYAKPSEKFCTKETMVRCLFDVSRAPSRAPATACATPADRLRARSKQIEASPRTCTRHVTLITYRVTYRVIVLLCYRKRKDEKNEKTSKKRIRLKLKRKIIKRI